MLSLFSAPGVICLDTSTGVRGGSDGIHLDAAAESARSDNELTRPGPTFKGMGQDWGLERAQNSS